MTVKGHQVRKAVFMAVPEYKPLQRINVRYVSERGYLISLYMGLLSSETTTVFAKVGVLEDTKDKITAEIAKLYPGKTVTSDDVSSFNGVDRYSRGFWIKVS